MDQRCWSNCTARSPKHRIPNCCSHRAVRTTSALSQRSSGSLPLARPVHTERCFPTLPWSCKGDSPPRAAAAAPRRRMRRVATSPRKARNVTRQQIRSQVRQVKEVKKKDRRATARPDRKPGRMEMVKLHLMGLRRSSTCQVDPRATWPRDRTTRGQDWLNRLRGRVKRARLLAKTVWPLAQRRRPLHSSRRSCHC